MIVDMHTHMWQSPDQLGPEIAEQLRRRFAGARDRLDAGPLAHEQAMDQIDVAAVLGFKSDYLQAEVPNSLIAEAMARRPGRVIGFAGIDPMTSGYLDEIDEAVANKFSGVTISPSAQDFHPVDTRAMRVYEKCQSLNLPVILHQGTHFTAATKMDYARPFQFDEVARSFPKLKLVIAHCGHPWTDETLILIGKHANVFAEISYLTTRPWQLYNLLLEAYQLEVTDQLLFGSDFPYATPTEAIETIYSLNRFCHGTGLPTVPRERLRSIVERDALACLGIRRSASEAALSEEDPDSKADEPVMNVDAPRLEAAEAPSDDADPSPDEAGVAADDEPADEDADRARA